MATATQAPPKSLSGQVEATKTKVNTIRDLMERSRPQIALALPKYMSADRMVRLAMTSILRNPQLLECDPLTLVGAVVQCAQLGLEPGSNYGAHLVPFWNNKAGKRDVQVIPDYRGLMGLCRNSEQISTIDAHAVYERDHFEFSYGKNPELVHHPHLQKDRGEIVYFYAIATLKDGGVQFIVLPRWEVDEIRDRYSRAASNGPWVTNYDEMGKKTCVRRLVDYLPARLEALVAAGLEAKAEQGIPQDLGALVEGVTEKGVVEAGKPAGAVQGLVDELRDRQGGGTNGAAHTLTESAGESSAAPSPEEQSQIRAREQEEAAQTMPPAAATAETPTDRAALVKEIGQLQDKRKMSAKDRVALQRKFCGNETLERAPIEALEKFRSHLRMMTGMLV